MKKLYVSNQQFHVAIHRTTGVIIAWQSSPLWGVAFLMLWVGKLLVARWIPLCSREDMIWDYNILDYTAI